MRHETIHAVTVTHSFRNIVRRSLVVGAAAGVLVMPVAAGASGYSGTDDGVEISDDTLTFGQQFTVSASGFKPASVVQVFMKSDPVLLGSLTADATGTVSGSFTVPAGTPAGSHTVEFQGTSPADVPLVLQQSVSVSASSGGGNATTGAAVIPFALAGAGLAGAGLMVRSLGRRRAGA